MRKRYPGTFKEKVTVEAIKSEDIHCRIIIEVRGPQGSDHALEKGVPEGFTRSFFRWQE